MFSYVAQQILASISQPRTCECRGSETSLPHGRTIDTTHRNYLSCCSSESCLHCIISKRLSTRPAFQSPISIILKHLQLLFNIGTTSTRGCLMWWPICQSCPGLAKAVMVLEMIHGDLWDPWNLRGPIGQWIWQTSKAIMVPFTSLGIPA